MSEHRSLVRVRLDVSYDGTDFAGWASQPGLRTVQATLEGALARVVRHDAPPRVTVAGRTDAGVHARGQVCHVDIAATAWDLMPGRKVRSAEEGLASRLRGVLPPDIWVTEVRAAPVGFDARFSALGRTYAYRVCDDASFRDPLARRHVWWHDRTLDLGLLADASRMLIGLRDFSPFCRARDGATAIRDLAQFSWERLTLGADAGLVVSTVRADAFCHSMVRSLVGAVIAVGDGRRDLDWLASVAGSTARSGAVTVAPAHGLTLESVEYPSDEALAQRAALTRARRTLD